MKYIALIPLLLCGCNTTSFEQTAPDGTVIRVVNNRFAWKTETYAIKLGENSITTSGSGADNEVIKSVAEGAVAGALKARP